MKLPLRLSLAAAALALAFGPAYAADNPALSDAPGFNELDKNDDGSLSRAEAAANPWLAERFSEVDDDKDGKLSRTEYLQRMARKDFNTLREKAADLIQPGDQSAESGSTAERK